MNFFSDEQLIEKVNRIIGEEGSSLRRRFPEFASVEVVGVVGDRLSFQVGLQKPSGEMKRVSLCVTRAAFKILSEDEIKRYLGQEVGILVRAMKKKVGLQNLIRKGVSEW